MFHPGDSVRWFGYWFPPALDPAAVTGLFLSNQNTIGPVIGLVVLVLREASGDRRQEIIVEGQIGLLDSGIAVQPSVFLD